MEGNSEERGKWKELQKLPTALLSFSFDAEVRGALHAFAPKKSEWGCNLDNNSIEFFMGVIWEPGRKYFLEGQEQMSSEDRRSHSFFLLV